MQCVHSRIYEFTHKETNKINNSKIIKDMSHEVCLKLSNESKKINMQNVSLAKIEPLSEHWLPHEFHIVNNLYNIFKKQ